MKQGLPQVDEHKVVVLSITYNQSGYIEDTLNGFAMQQTDFPFLCCVFDDASTDGEQEVLKHWIEVHCNAEEVEVFDHPLTIILKAPDRDNSNCVYVFHLFKENLFRKPEKTALLNYWRKFGKYEAMCEGDDYWIDPLKLQKQVDFLEAHSDYSMCFAHAIEHFEDGSKEDRLFSTFEERDYEGVELFEKWIVPTASVLYRREIICTDLYQEVRTNKKLFFGDTPLFLTCAHYGKLRGFSDVFSVYRRHVGGMTSTALKNYDSYKRYQYHILEIHKVFGDAYKKKSIEFFIYGHCNVFWETFWKKDVKTRYDFLWEALSVSVWGCLKYFYAKSRKILRELKGGQV